MLQKEVSTGYQKPSVNIKLLYLELFIHYYFLFKCLTKKYRIKEVKQVCIHLIAITLS